MAEERDGARVRVPPPLIYAAMIGLGFGLGYVWPLPLAPGEPIRIGGGIALIVGGLWLGVSAHRRFTSTGQDPKPWLPTPKIVSEGPFLHTRNPMYVAMALMQLGIGTAVANAWIVMLSVPSLVLVHLLAVLPEEAYLESKFGEGYLKYKRTVRRWL